MAVARNNKARKSRKGFAFVSGIAVCAAVVVAVGIGFNVASAGVDNSNAALGLSSTAEASSANTQATTQSEATASAQAPGQATTTTTDSSFGVFDSASDESSQLTKTARRDISKGIEAITAKEEAERRAAEEAARAAEEKRQAEEAARQAELAAIHTQVNAQALAAGLEPVNWDLDHDAFVAQWASRIDAYLAGYPLEGQGKTFAEAAWTYGVDPRMSPAISNTESTRGMHCSVAYNAWGWGPHIPFPNWETAINTHVKGLADGYGGSISLGVAQKYCPPTYESWYQNTLSQMLLI